MTHAAAYRPKVSKQRMHDQHCWRCGTGLHRAGFQRTAADRVSANTVAAGCLWCLAALRSIEHILAAIVTSCVTDVCPPVSALTGRTASRNWFSRSCADFDNFQANLQISGMLIADVPAACNVAHGATWPSAPSRPHSYLTAELRTVSVTCSI